MPLRLCGHSATSHLTPRFQPSRIRPRSAGSSQRMLRAHLHCMLLLLWSHLQGGRAQGPGRQVQRGLSCRFFADGLSVYRPKVQLNEPPRYLRPGAERRVPPNSPTSSYVSGRHRAQPGRPQRSAYRIRRRCGSARVLLNSARTPDRIAGVPARKPGWRRAAPLCWSPCGEKPSPPSLHRYRRNRD